MLWKIIALAVAGLVSGGVFAQSNVTVSGNMKLNFDSISAGGATNGLTHVSRTRVSDNNSNIKFAGEESLGNGNTAFFFIESAVGTDNDAGTAYGQNNPIKGTTIGSRDTGVGIKGSWGSVDLGKFSVQYPAMANIETAGIADSLHMATSSLNLFTGAGLSTILRLQNSIRYNSPKFSGFGGTLVYSTGNGSFSESATNGTPNKENAWNLRLAYDNGPINATYAHHRSNNTGAIAASNVCLSTAGAISQSVAACPAGTGAIAALALSNGTDIRSDRLGGAYTFPMGLKVGLIWDNTKNTAKTTGVETKRKAWALPLTYTMGANRFSFTYGKANNLNTAGADVADSETKMTMLGYEYAMSKRTSLTAQWVALNNGSAGTNDFWHAANNVSGGGAVTAGSDPRLFSLGVHHKF
jgi:predicted porin